MTSLIFRRLLYKLPQINRKTFHTTSCTGTFWESGKRSGYTSEPNVSQKQLILDGLKQLREEISLWRDEVKEKLESDPIMVVRPGEIDVVWSFNTVADVDKWIVTTDKDHNEGHSVADLEISPSGCGGLFHGNVESQLPKDGKIKKAGYCNIKTLRARVSFTFYRSLRNRKIDLISSIFRNHSNGKLILIGNSTTH